MNGKKIVSDYIAQDPAKSEEMVELSIFIDNHLDNALKAQREACMESIHKSAGLTEHELRHVTMLDKIREAILNARIEE